jgi:hypothetical protein
MYSVFVPHTTCNLQPNVFQHTCHVKGVRDSTSVQAHVLEEVLADCLLPMLCSVNDRPRDTAFSGTSSWPWWMKQTVPLIGQHININTYKHASLLSLQASPLVGMVTNSKVIPMSGM